MRGPGGGAFPERTRLDMEKRQTAHASSMTVTSPRVFQYLQRHRLPCAPGGLRGGCDSPPSRTSAAPGPASSGAAAGRADRRGRGAPS